MAFRITEVKINEMHEPVGLDENTPIFSWLLSAEGGMKQKAAQVLVGTQPESGDCWDSGMMENDRSINIPYEGTALKAETRYYVTVRVWDTEGELQEGQSFFETGLLNPHISAWEGAEWIGAPEYLVASDTISVFTIESTIHIKEGNRGGIVFGANDYRLLDKEKNESLIEGENYFRYVLDISEIPAKIDIYRVGYAPGDSADKPFVSFPVIEVKTGEPVITASNSRKPHKLTIEVIGNTAFTYVDDIRIDQVESVFFGRTIIDGRQLNPLGERDVTTFPRLNEIGYYAGEGSKVHFDGLHVRNFRKPHAEIASLDVAEGKFLSGEVQEVTNPSCHSLPMLRREFKVEKKVSTARLYATARGIYECSINGHRVGNEYFAPGSSQYDKHLMYQTYDVTDHIKSGENAVGCTLASGWWSDSCTFTVNNYNYWGDRMSFLAKLVLVYEDGSRDVIVTDTSNWQYFGEGPYRYAGFFNGEQYDARRAALFRNFSKPGFAENTLLAVGMKTSDLKPPEVITPVPIPPNDLSSPSTWPGVNETEPELVGNYLAPVHEVELLTAKSMSEPAPGIYIYDLGQEIAGVPLLKLNGREGQKIMIRYGEMLYPKLEKYGPLAGRMLQANIREASNTDIYICNGKGEEIYKPKFTFHGFRYIEISGIAEPPALEDVKGILLSSVTEITGKFHCSNPLVNQLVSNVGYSQRCNFISIPTDCPQRNERMGWVGDTHLFCRTATYQSSTKNFYLRSLQAMRDLQTPEGRLTNIAPVGGGFGGITYESAMILIVWELYQQYGDDSIIREFYPCMKKWMEAMKLAGFPGTPDEFGLGDWLSPEETDNYLIWNAFHYRNAFRMQFYAEHLGETEDTAYYQKLADEAKNYWNKKFINPMDGRTQTVHGTPVDTQGSYAIALSCGVIADEYVRKAYDHLARKTRECGCTVQTGFFGTGPLNTMLCAGGYPELAQALINQTACPSWLYPVTQGATTVWERWDSYTIEQGFSKSNATNSFNHYSLGCVLSWLYENVLGIQRDEENSGYKHFTLKPEIGGFEYAEGGIDTPYGRIESSWEQKDGKIRYRCVVPANTTATLVLNGQQKELSSGSYEF